MLLTLDELEKSQDVTYLALKDDFFVFPEGEHSSERFGLRLKAQQRIDDIVMFHRYVTTVYESNKVQYEPVYKKFNEHYAHMFDEISEEKKHLARMSFPNFNWKEEQEQVRAISNESLIINLWATIEQFTNRTAKLVNPEGNSSHHWNVVKQSLSNFGIDVTAISSYSSINELRVVNNKIKHLYYVDEQLSQFESFNGCQGQSLNSINFELQRYISSSYHFLIALINLVGESIYYPE
ncbi:hypothetical protein SAMN05660691_01307 [Rheinheimera pacifica]|uniref:Uncharacterized protein n=1 Tax=Rheinheimera pacifica TaxID=173990 RepID=A0A1H6KWU0_9GAMM|nr:hypothetical protein [Rheinheimera pacifica]SEH77428.1 hypothetical protein SAMN05660691_01307 [Rheinheimera pacifica]